MNLNLKLIYYAKTRIKYIADINITHKIIKLLENIVGQHCRTYGSAECLDTKTCFIKGNNDKLISSIVNTFALAKALVKKMKRQLSYRLRENICKPNIP